MSLNCNELNVILSELDLDFSFIQEIVQPGFDTLAFRAFKQGVSHTILICTSANACRINETQKKIPKNEKPLRFNEFLKSRLMGARINSVQQIGFDRIIKFNVSYYDEQLYLYVRLWSGAANVIVTDDKGIIQDCMFRRPAKGETTGGTFLPQEKTYTPEEIASIKEKFPVRDFTESSAENSGASSGDNLTFNQKVDAFYSEHAVVLSRESLLSQAEKWYNTKHSKMKAALEKLLEKKRAFANAATLKHTGDLVLSFGSQAVGSTLDCTDYDTGKEVHIRLDPHKSVQENAAFYYEQYKKAISGIDALEHDIALSEKNLAALDEEYQAMLNQKNVLIQVI